MSVLVYIESQDQQIKKTSLEAASMANSLAKELGVTIKAVIASDVEGDEVQKIGVSGISEVIQLGSNSMIAQELASQIADVAKSESASVVITSHSTLTEGVVSRLAIKLNGTPVTNVLGLPDTSSGFKVRKGIYTSKAFAMLSINTDVKILTMKKGSFEIGGENVSVNVSMSNVGGEILGDYKIIATKKQEGDILLPEADLVVSAGRGLKGPENWGMIEELAQTIGAATACSKPVSDVDWRPHHEHVGQTGIKISPNLYIAIGISGAIQHLAGVSSSKVIVVINTDEDAPFFKAADYGIVGDAFEVVPKLIQALKNV